MAKSFISYHVEERSFASYIKREIHKEVSSGKFTEQQAGEIDIIVSELISNLVKHAGSGELLYRVYNHDEHSTFEIVCIDAGPGMENLAQMKKDGVSTTQTLGQGLGAIERLSTFSQVYSLSGWGTILFARVSTLQEAGYVPRMGHGLDISAMCVNKPRETVCGDGYRIKRVGGLTQIFFGDGLGHGQHAKEAVDFAGDFFFECNENDPVDIIRHMHEKVRRTRGLVATVVTFDGVNNEWKLCGVGNISTRMYQGLTYRSYPSYNGTIGLNIPSSMKSTVYPVDKRQFLVMNSDGLQSRLDLTRYPSIFKYDGSVLAAVLYKDFSRRNDDTSVLIAKVT